jgi:hypothetical protein
MTVILQYYTWHSAEAIKRKLIAKGYTKEACDKIINFI